MKLRVVNEAEFKTAIEDNEILLVDMYAEWCGPCKMLGPVLEDIALKYNPKVKIIKVDVDNTPSIASEYHVQSVPTVLFFYNGKLKQTLVGFQSKNRFESLLDPIV